MGREILSQSDYRALFAGTNFQAQFDRSKTTANVLADKIINDPIYITPATVINVFKNCQFNNVVCFLPTKVIDGDDVDVFEKEIVFENNCEFNLCLNITTVKFVNKFRIHSCIISKLVIHNAVFDGLADFWATKFKNSVTFYKTDFNATAVFSMATFEENVLFTYSLLAGKSIFAKTEFKNGLDLSQAIISGDLKLFDIHFENDEFQTKYFKRSEKAAYQNAIDNLGVIPTENKVHTFQILRKASEDVGNYDDATKMRRAEKTARREYNLNEIGAISLTSTLLDAKRPMLARYAGIVFEPSFWQEIFSNDGFILALNRNSNNYKTSFWRGVSFTFIITAVFGFITLFFTQSFWNAISSICLDCSINETVFSKGLKFFFNFLNPARRINDLEQLEPIYGIAYIFDFLGRIAVGYGIYQTIQAFRKFK